MNRLQRRRWLDRRKCLKKKRRIFLRRNSRNLCYCYENSWVFFYEVEESTVRLSVGLHAVQSIEESLQLFSINMCIITLHTLESALGIDKTYRKHNIYIQIKFSLKVTTWPTWWLSLPFPSIFVSYGDFRQLTPRSPEIMHVHYSVYLSAQKSTDSFPEQL